MTAPKAHPSHPRPASRGNDAGPGGASSLLGRRFIPPIGSLVALEAAVRTGSFTRAAEELHLTQAAISRQILQLEARLGIKLFDRVKNRVVPTPAGQAYADRIHDILGQFATATAQAIAYRDGGGTLDLAVLPTLGARWLMPRIGRFITAHREIAVNFSTRVRTVDLRRERLDAAIVRGHPHQPGLDVHKLMAEELVAVAAPPLVAAMADGDPARLAEIALLVQETRPDAWSEWFEAQGLAPPIERHTVVFEQFLLVIRAAVAGLGAAIVPRFLIEDELRSGELGLVPGRPVFNDDGYYFIHPSEYRDRPPIRAFRDWLLTIATEQSATR